MSSEQKNILVRLAIVTASLALVALAGYFVYRPKTVTESEKPPILPSQKTAFPALFRSGRWLISLNSSGKWDSSSNGSIEFSFGSMGDSPLVGAWDGVSGTSIGLYSKGRFSLLIDGKIVSHSFGDPSYLPVVGDWNGDGRTKIGAFNKGFWLLDMNGNSRWDDVQVDRLVSLGGVAGDIPLVGDWNGDGRTKVGIFRQPGVFQLDYNGNGIWDKEDRMDYLGEKGDIPVVGDWTGDGRTKIGIFHNGFWLLDMNGNGKWDGPPEDRLVALGGVAGDVPVVGDWNGDGRTKVGVYRAGSFQLDFNGNGVWDKDDKIFNFGHVGDIPLILNPRRHKK